MDWKQTVCVSVSIACLCGCAANQQLYEGCRSELDAQRRLTEKEAEIARTNAESQAKLIAELKQDVENQKAAEAQLRVELADKEKSHPPQEAKAACPEKPCPSGEVAADIEKQLVQFITREQKRWVKKSYSEHNCFTDMDLNRFHQQNKAEQVARSLQQNRAFVTLAEKYASLCAEQQDQVSEAGKGTHAQTWAECGAITPKCQTDAGQAAEMSLADAIVETLQRLAENG